MSASEKAEEAKGRQTSTDATRASAQVQSILLRLCLVCASSQATLREALPLDVRPYSSESGKQVAVPSLAEDDKLRSQIHNDIAVLMKSMQKHATALTLAMRPGKSGVADESSPTSNLDLPSLQAALAQLTPLLSDVTPKLVFLSRKATQARAVYTLPPQTEAQKKKRAEMERKVRAAGGNVVFNTPGAAEGLFGHTGRQSAPPRNGTRVAGVGIAWANDVRRAVEKTLDALAALADAFLDGRTRKALDGAEAARLRKAGQKVQPATAEFDTSLSAAPSRQIALVRAKALNTACEEAISALPKDNAVAVSTEWVTRAELLDDSLRELKEAIEADMSAALETPAEVVDDAQDDGFGIFDDDGMTLSLEDRERAKAFIPLLEATTELHATLYKVLLRPGTESSPELDLDKLNSAAQCLEVSYEDLVSALLYGDDAAGDDDDEVAESDEEGSSEDPSADPDTRAVHRVYDAYIKTVEQLYEISLEGSAADEVGESKEQLLEQPMSAFRSAAAQVKQDMAGWNAEAL